MSSSAIEARAASYAVEKILPRGTFTLIAGPPKCGKTRFALRLFLEAVNTRRALSFESFCNGASLYMSSESPNVIARHIRDLSLTTLPQDDKPAKALFSFYGKGADIADLLVVDCARNADSVRKIIDAACEASCDSPVARLSTVIVLPTGRREEIATDVEAAVDTVIRVNGAQAHFESRWFESFSLDLREP